MLSFLAEFESYWGPLRLFRYITFRALFGSATALVLAFLFAVQPLVGTGGMRLQDSISLQIQTCKRDSI